MHVKRNDKEFQNLKERIKNSKFLVNRVLNKLVAAR